MEALITRLEELRAARVLLRTLPENRKNQILLTLSKKLREQSDGILACNKLDVADFKQRPGYQVSLVDRLTLSEARIEQMSRSLVEVAALEDPVGKAVETKTLPNGLLLEKRRSPLGVIFLIFEARPNVITEAFSLALKSGNALILKGGKESDRTSAFIYDLIMQTLRSENVSTGIFWGLVGASREATDFLMKQNKFIDVLIPRGGEKLIEHVTNHSNIPIIKNDRGLCHIYVHEMSDLAMALEIIDNAKTQRPSVCNAAETLIVDQAVAARFLPMLFERFETKGVILYVCAKASMLLPKGPLIYPATETSYATEYLELKLNVRVVDGIDEALAHIEKYSSRHSEAIITADVSAAKYFEANVDSAAVYWNASTRFTDGGQFGLGAEIGISTQKLHVRGPVGLEALTSLRWVIDGQGQIRPS